MTEGGRQKTDAEDAAGNKENKKSCPPRSALTVLKQRAEFLAVAHTGKKWVAPGLILQMGAPREKPTLPIRYGLTASGKVGNAVIRNRSRRRLRALAVELLPHASAAHDYVLIARSTTATRDFSELKKDLMLALKKLGVWHETI